VITGTSRKLSKKLFKNTQVFNYEKLHYKPIVTFSGRWVTLAKKLRPLQQNRFHRTQKHRKKLKPCCACPETKKARDACIIENGEENCQHLIEAHKECMRKAGFNI
ncbi:hypothetical protein NQ318_022359, partial [Aromia moschata]